MKLATSKQGLPSIMKLTEDVLALTVAILRLQPNYLKYRVADYEVELKWAEDRKSVEVFYKLHEVVIFAVKATVAKQDDRIKLSATLVPVARPENLHARHAVDTLYLLLQVITKINFENDKELEDTDESITRYW